MPQTVVFESEYASLWYYPEQKIVHHKFHKLIYGRDFREVLNSGYDLMKQHNCHKWLSDDRNNSGLPLADVEWAKTDWFPRVMAAGWKYWALVQPEKIIGQMNMKQFTNEYSQMGLTVKVFSDPAEALKWLEAQGERVGASK